MSSFCFDLDRRDYATRTWRDFSTRLSLSWIDARHHYWNYESNQRSRRYIYIYIENLSVSIYTLCRNYVEVEGKLRPIKGRWHAWTKKAWLVKSFHVAACLGALSLSLVVASTRGTSMTSFIGISAPRPERHVADVPLLISRESGRRRNLIIGR